MKNIFFAALVIFVFGSCNTNENELVFIGPVSAVKIEKIQIDGRQITITVAYGIPTPCWHFYTSESTNNETTFTTKTFAKSNGEPCIQVLWSFKHDEKIIFPSAGEKNLRFWQNDSTYLDTTITL